MPEISPARNNIFTESVQYKSSVSESIGNRIGASINFINTRQYDTHQFNFNGRYALGVGVVGADGIFPILFNMEIVGLTMFNRVAGTSGTTEVDIDWLNGSNSNQGTIFSVTPKMASTAPNLAYLIRDELNSVNIELPTGATAPTFIKTEFDAGDALLIEIVSAMSDAEDLSVLIHFRPR